MFNCKKIINGRINVPETESLPTTASEVYKEGEALVLSSGKLTKASGTTKPTHISLADYTAPASGQKDLPCYRIAPNMVFEVPVSFSETAAAIVVGSKLKVDTDGLGVTDVTTGGVITVVDALDANTNKSNGDLIDKHHKFHQNLLINLMYQCNALRNHLHTHYLKMYESHN